MARILAVLLWPAGLAVIAGIAVFLVRRWPDPLPSHARAAHRLPANGADATAERNPRAGTQALDAARLVLILLAGAVAVIAIMSLLGKLVVHFGPAIDKPVYHWTVSHREHAWTAVMRRLTKIGNIWTTWGAAGAAACCLAATYRRTRWLAPTALGTLIVGDHFFIKAIHHFVHRIGPPNSPHGTFPSGGAERCIIFYGLIAYLLWREFSGSRRAAVWSAAAVAALGFNEAYSRGYLTLHWLTDILGGLLYGTLLLAVFIVAVHMVAGPARLPAPQSAAPDQIAGHARVDAQPGGTAARDQAREGSPT